MIGFDRMFRKYLSRWAIRRVSEYGVDQGGPIFMQFKRPPLILPNLQEWEARNSDVSMPARISAR
jgi:hypothetical protein